MKNYNAAEMITAQDTRNNQSKNYKDITNSILQIF